MANLTIAIEDDVLKKARLKAVEDGTSVNAVVREFLREYTGNAPARLESAKRLIALAHESAAQVGPITWTREELHDRKAARR
jgi:plasmid stability protein